MFTCLLLIFATRWEPFIFINFYILIPTGRNARYDERMARHVAKQAEKAMGDKLLNDIEGSKETFVESTVSSASSTSNSSMSGVDIAPSKATVVSSPTPRMIKGSGGSIAGAVAAISSSPGASDPMQPGPTSTVAASPVMTSGERDVTKQPVQHCWFFFWCRTY